MAQVALGLYPPLLRVDSKVLPGLPCSINRLVNLQTLDIRRTTVKEIDAMFWTIKTLRHVLTEKLMLPAAATLVEEMGNLMTLHGVTPGKEDWEGDSPLHKMPNLRSLKACSFGWWLVLICSERKVLLDGCWCLVCSERKVLLAGGL
jgi:hypothetical protein